jgi:predicted nucleic acid-binding protein
VLVVLDSTVLIDYLRGRPAVDRVRALRPRGDVPATTAINVEEIVRGLKGAEHDAAERLFRGLLVLPIDEATAWQAGTWRRSFAESGITLFQADCLIAAATHSRQAVLCTGNPTDFPMRDLTVQHWPVGE